MLEFEMAASRGSLVRNQILLIQCTSIFQRCNYLAVCSARSSTPGSYDWGGKKNHHEEGLEEKNIPALH
jgi:hypothetical protein